MITHDFSRLMLCSWNIAHRTGLEVKFLLSNKYTIFKATEWSGSGVCSLYRWRQPKKKLLLVYKIENISRFAYRLGERKRGKICKWGCKQSFFPPHLIWFQSMKKFISHELCSVLYVHEVDIVCESDYKLIGA